MVFLTTPFLWPFSVTFNFENAPNAAALSAEIENVLLSHKHKTEMRQDIVGACRLNNSVCWFPATRLPVRPRNFYAAIIIRLKLLHFALHFNYSTTAREEERHLGNVAQFKREWKRKGKAKWHGGSIANKLLPRCLVMPSVPLSLANASARPPPTACFLLPRPHRPPTARQSSV